MKDRQTKINILASFIQALNNEYKKKPRAYILRWIKESTIKKIRLESGVNK